MYGKNYVIQEKEIFPISIKNQLKDKPILAEQMTTVEDIHQNLDNIAYEFDQTYNKANSQLLNY